MSVWQFMACLDGYRRAHSAEDERPRGQEMTEERARDLGIEGF